MGSSVYAADGLGGLQVIDASNPALPSIVGSVDTPGIARGVVISGSMAYVSDDAGGLAAIDVSNPALPILVGSVDLPDLAYGVAVSGSVAYVAANTAGLQVIDLSNPAAPVLVGSMNTPGLAWGVVVSGQRSVRGRRRFGSRHPPEQCNLTRFCFPVHGAIGPGGAPSRVGYFQRVGFLRLPCPRSTRSGGDEVRLTQELIPPSTSYRFSTRRLSRGPPTTTGWRPSTAAGIEITSDRWRRVGIPRTSFQHPRNWDRATRILSGVGGGATAIPFTLGQEGHVTLRVFDLSGRQVRVLVEEAMGEGSTWFPGTDGTIGVRSPPRDLPLYAGGPGLRATRRMVRIR